MPVCWYTKLSQTYQNTKKRTERKTYTVARFDFGYRESCVIGLIVLRSLLLYEILRFPKLGNLPLTLCSFIDTITVSCFSYFTYRWINLYVRTDLLYFDTRLFLWAEWFTPRWTLLSVCVGFEFGTSGMGVATCDRYMCLRYLMPPLGTGYRKYIICTVCD